MQKNQLAEDLLRHILDALVNAERSGTKQDIPEGIRYITISDTLVNELIIQINEVLS